MNAFERWLHRPVPRERLALMRVLVFGYAAAFLVARGPSFWSAADLPPSRWRPVGVLWWLDTAPPTVVIRAVFILTIVVLGIAAAGRWWRVAGPLGAALFLATATARLSWGHVIHTEHLVTLHLVILGLSAAAADTWSLDARRSTSPGPSERDGVPLRLMAIGLVITYVLAGWMKIRNGGGDWLTGDVLRNQIAFDNLRKELLGSPHSPLGGWLVGIPWVFSPIAWVTVAVEIGAPLALLGRRWSATWAAAAWAFHVGIVALMAISFPYQLTGIAYLCLLEPERWVRQCVARFGRRSGTMGRWRLSRTGSTVT